MILVFIKRDLMILTCAYAMKIISYSLIRGHL